MPPHSLPLPSDASPDEQIKAAVFDLVERARAFKLEIEGLSKLDQGAMRSLLTEHFQSEERYGARWSLRALFFADDEASLRTILEAGFPIEAPIAFARGNLACEAAMIGSWKCLALLADLGADLNSPNDHGDTPIELAAETCSENVNGAACCAILCARGAFASIQARQDNLRERLAPELGPDPQITPLACLGHLMLNSLRRDWDDVVGWNNRAGRGMPELCFDIAERLDALQEASGQADADFFGPSLSLLLAKMQLPQEIESARSARLDRRALHEQENALAALRPWARGDLEEHDSPRL